MKIANLYISFLLSGMTFLIIPYLGSGQDEKNQQQLNIQLKDYSTHFVEGKNSYKYRDSANTVKESKTAYLVFFDLANMPKTPGPALEIYIGDYKVPEYGGTKSGIYFRVYDPKLLQRLNNQMVYYRFGKGEKKSFNKQFGTPDTKNMKKESEEELIKAKNK